MSHATLWMYVSLTTFVFSAIFGVGFACGGMYATKPPAIIHLPVVEVSASRALQQELDRCQALTKQQIEVLDDDRRLSETACERRIEELVNGRYPKGGKLMVRSGRHPGSVGWFVGAAEPKGVCDPGSVYSRTEGHVALYACEGGTWRSK